MSIKLRKVINISGFDKATNRGAFESTNVTGVICLILFVFLFLLVPEKVLAGVDNAQISCKSTSLRAAPLYLSGEIPGDLAGFELTLKRNKAELIMSEEEEEEIFVVEDFPRRVFSMVVKRPRTHLLLYAIPSTVSIKQNDAELLKVKFSAILLQAPNPEKDGFLDEVKMSCTYEYSV